jgi:hypothetical protein
MIKNKILKEEFFREFLEISNEEKKSEILKGFGKILIWIR